MIEKVFGNKKIFGVHIKESTTAKKFCLRLYVHGLSLGLFTRRANLNILIDEYKSLLQRMEHSYEPIFATMSYEEIILDLYKGIGGDFTKIEMEFNIQRADKFHFYDPRFNPYTFNIYKTPENKVVILLVNGNSNKPKLASYTGYEVDYNYFKGVFEELIKYSTADDLLE